MTRIVKFALSLVVIGSIAFSVSKVEGVQIPSSESAGAMTPFASAVRAFTVRTNGCLYSYREEKDRWMIYGRPHPVLNRLGQPNHETCVLLGTDHTLTLRTLDRAPSSLSEAEQKGQVIYSRPFRPFVRACWQEKYCSPGDMDLGTNDWISIDLVSVGAHLQRISIRNSDSIKLAPDSHLWGGLELSCPPVPLGRFERSDQLRVVTRWSRQGSAQSYPQIETVRFDDWPHRLTRQPGPEVLKALEAERDHQFVRRGLQVSLIAALILSAVGVAASAYTQARSKLRSHRQEWPGVSRGAEA